jgi:hypothetical protein
MRWAVRSRVAEHPDIYLPLARRRYPDAVVGSETELVIDGFTRSAVTFATIAFQMAQHRPVRVAHTLHAAGHVIAAVRAGIPTLVAIRDPEETVLSTVVREPYVTLRTALIAYTRFYRRILPFRSGFVVGEFTQVVHDFGEVVNAVNRRFATNFDVFEQTEDNVRRCYDIIEDRARHPPWSKALGEFECGIISFDQYRRAVEEHRSLGLEPKLEVPERRVQRPSRQREILKQELRQQLELRSYQPELAEARGVFHQLVAQDPPTRS